jgi:hypothetical protein
VRVVAARVKTFIDVTPEGVRPALGLLQLEFRLRKVPDPQPVVGQLRMSCCCNGHSESAGAWLNGSLHRVSGSSRIKPESSFSIRHQRIEFRLESGRQDVMLIR